MSIKIQDIKIVESDNIEMIKQALKDGNFFTYPHLIIFNNKRTKAYYIMTESGKEMIALHNYILYKYTDMVIFKIKVNKEIKEIIRAHKRKTIDDTVKILICNDVRAKKSVIHYETYAYAYTEILRKKKQPDMDAIIAHAVFDL